MKSIGVDYFYHLAKVFLQKVLLDPKYRTLMSCIYFKINGEYAIKMNVLNTTKARKFFVSSTDKNVISPAEI